MEESPVQEKHGISLWNKRRCAREYFDFQNDTVFKIRKKDKRKGMHVDDLVNSDY